MGGGQGDGLAPETFTVGTYPPDTLRLGASFGAATFAGATAFAGGAAAFAGLAGCAGAAAFAGAAVVVGTAAGAAEVVDSFATLSEGQTDAAVVTAAEADGAP